MRSFLVVDDDEAFIDYIAEIIHIIGHTVVDKAYDGVQAVEIFAEDPNRFDVVLMDIIMPQKNGISAAREMRRIAHDMRIVLMSANSENQRFIYETDNVGFLLKPFGAEVLAAELQKL